jgi:plasmid maintenance system antidote protein VapI
MAGQEKKLPPIHPGEILREEFMAPLGLSTNRLALDLRVPATRIHAIRGSAILLAIPQCAWRDTSAPALRSG